MHLNKGKNLEGFALHHQLEFELEIATYCSADTAVLHEENTCSKPFWDVIFCTVQKLRRLSSTQPWSLEYLSLPLRI